MRRLTDKPCHQKSHPRLLSRPCGKPARGLNIPSMVETVISIRAARLGDEGEIATVHDAAWREAYRGVIPGRELERMIARRGPEWWRARNRAPDAAARAGVWRIHGRRLRQLWAQSGAGARLRRGDLSSSTCRRNVRGAASAGACSMLSRKDLASHGLCDSSSSGRWRITSGRSGSIAGSAAGSFAGRTRPLAARSASGSLSALAEALLPL